MEAKRFMSDDRLIGEESSGNEKGALGFKIFLNASWVESVILEPS